MDTGLLVLSAIHKSQNVG